MSTDANALARELGCLCEEEIAALTGCEVSTLRNWRAKRYGPPFVMLGNRCLYPIAQAREWIERNAEATISANTVFESGTKRRRPKP